MPRLTFAAVVAALVLAAPAEARWQAVPTAPVLFGDRVLWTAPGDGVTRVLAAPVTGGAEAAFGAVPSARTDTATLAAAAGTVALSLRDPRSLAGDGRLFLAGADGAFREVADDVGDPPLTPWVPGLSVTAAGALTLEDGVAALLRDGTRATEIALPPGADPQIVAAAGELGVAPTPDGTLVVFDLRTGTEQRQISLGRFDQSLNGLTISPEGDVAATVPVGDGGDVLLWAPHGASRVRVLRTGREYSSVAAAGGRVAFAGADGLRDGIRVTVVDAASRRTVFRGPPVFDVRGLGFDGTRVAFAASDCGLVGSGSLRTLPAGPCVRSEVAATPSRGGVRVACINAPAGACRVSVRVKRRGKTVRFLRTQVRAGAARLLAAPRGRVEVRVTDPGGRWRTAYAD